MNNFENIYSIDGEQRKITNTELQDGYKLFTRVKDCLSFIKDKPEYEAIKDAIKGKGKLEVITRVRNTLAGNPKYCLVLNEDDGYKVYLFSIASGLYNEMGPFPTVDSALSRADCYGLFEGRKAMKDELFRRIREAVGDYIGDDEDGNPIYDGGEEEWDDESDDFSDGEMEDFDYAQMDDDFVGPTPAKEHYDDLADSFSLVEPEYQDNEGEPQLGDGPFTAGRRSKQAAYAANLYSGNNAATYEDEDTPIGGDFSGKKFGGFTDKTNADFAMFNDADLDEFTHY